MDSRNQDFYDLNGGRGYPLDDRANRTGDDGARIQNDVLVDLSLRFPDDLGRYAFLSSLAVTDALVTATFLACPSADSPPAEFRPLAAVTVRKPVTAGRHYPLSPLADGVGGWVVFGDTGEKFSARFSTPAQGLLLPRVARPYRTPPVTSVRKSGAAAGLTGVVRLKAGTDVEILGAERVVDGRTRTVAVVRLRSFSGARNVFSLYKGPCGGRPESGTCDRPGVEFFNSVAPDAAGNVEILFGGGLEATAFAGGGGMVLDYPLGNADVCVTAKRLPGKDGALPTEYADGCSSEYGPPPEDFSDGIGTTPPTANVPDVSSEYPDCPPLPFLETFDSLTAAGFQVASGAFAFAADDSPGQEGYDDWLDASSQSSQGAPRGAYCAFGTETRNVSLWDSCALDSTVGKAVTADLRFLAGGPKSNAGLVLNYRGVGTPPHDEYFLAEVDAGTDSLRLRRWTGTVFSTVGEATGVGLFPEHWYRVRAEVTPGPDPGSQTRIAVYLDGVTDPAVTASLVTVTTQYLPGSGRFGVTSDQAYAQFSYFRVDEV